MDPAPPAGRDLRMSEYESAQAARWPAADQLAQDQFGLTQEQFAFQRDEAAKGWDWKREEATATKLYRDAELKYRADHDAAVDATTAARDMADSQYKMGMLANAQAQLAESKRQFEQAEARLRRAQALAEIQVKQKEREDFLTRYGQTPEYLGVPGYAQISASDIASWGNNYAGGG